MNRRRPEPGEDPLAFLPQVPDQIGAAQERGSGVAIMSGELTDEADRIAVEHPPPLGIRGLAQRWVDLVRAEEVIADCYDGESGRWTNVESRPDLTDYELGALLGWVRRECERETAFRRELRAEYIAERLGIDVEAAKALVEVAVMSRRRVNKRETARARKQFGDDAIAYSERSHRFDKGKLAGRCTTCFREDCTERSSMTVAVDQGFFLSIKGQAHSWSAAWRKADRRHTAETLLRHAEENLR